MTPPETPDRNPFVPVVGLVLVLALLAGFGSRYGLNSVVATLCVLGAMVGTWLLLSPQFPVLAPTRHPGTAPQTGSPAPTNSAFVAPDTGSREALKKAPRVAVGFGEPDAQDPGVAVRTLADVGGDPFAESVVPVQALGQLPRDAQGIEVSLDVNPEKNISDAYTLGRFEVRASSRLGSDHAILGEARQDDYAVVTAAGGRYLVVVVADGVPVAENAHFGAHWACRLLAKAIDHNLREGIPGIEKMLSRARDELTTCFNARFDDGTKMRTVATTLVGLIAPVDGGPAAGFRIGAGDILVHGSDGFSSVFGACADQENEVVFPKDVDAEVAPIELDVNCLLLASDGVTDAIDHAEHVSDSFVHRLAEPLSSDDFTALTNFDHELARGDRTAVAVWFSPSA